MPDRVRNGESLIAILKENVPKVLAALRALPDGNGAPTELVPVLQRFGLEAREDAEGNVTDVCLAAEYLDGRVEAAFKAMAPFVIPESYIMFLGEDREQWAYVFRENRETRAVEVHREAVIPLLASEYRKLTGRDAP